MQLCEYGCGKEGKFLLKKSKKWCCNPSYNSCETAREKNRQSNSGEKNGNYGRKHTQEENDKVSKANKGMIPWNKGKIGVYSEESLNKMREWTPTEETRKNMRDGQKRGRLNEDSYWFSEEYSKRNEKWRERMLNGGAAYMCSCNKNPSPPQVELYNIIKTIISTTILNYPIIEINRCLDIAIPQLKICFEHDMEFHKYKKKEDNERQDEIEKLGWTMIRYKNMPTKDQIIKDMNKFLFLD
jgi:hypothetical protein